MSLPLHTKFDDRRNNDLIFTVTMTMATTLA